MIKLFASVVALFALTAIAHATEPRKGYPPYVYHQHDHYHRHDHFHYVVPSPGWYYAYPPSYSFEYRYPPRTRYIKTKRTGKPSARRDPNWYYCKSYWRQPAHMTEGPRFWWPYFNPRPGDAKSDPDTPPKVYTAKAWAPGSADPCNHKNNVLIAPGSRPY